MKLIKTLSLFAVVFLLIPVAATHAVIQNLNGLTPSTQTFATTTDANVRVSIISSGSIHTFAPNWIGILQPARGGTGTSGYATGSALFFQDNKISEDNLNFFWNDTTKTLSVQNLLFSSSTGSGIFLTTLNVSGSSTINSLTLSSPLGASSGGTGNSGYTKGDILVAQDSNTLVKLPHGQDGQVLMSSSTAPYGIAWVSLVSASPYFQVDTGGTLMNGLVAYYKLDNDVVDASDNGYDGSNVSGTWITGKVGNAIHFASVSSQYASTAVYPQQSDMSVFLWVKTDSTETSKSMISQDDAGQRAFEFFVSSNADHLNFSPGGGGSESTGSVSSGSWVFVGVTFTASTKTSTYYIGSATSDSSKVDSQTPQFSTATGQIGRRDYGGGPDHYMDGAVDEIGAWNRVLTSQEITDLYNGGNGNTIVQ